MIVRIILEFPGESNEKFDKRSALTFVRPGVTWVDMMLEDWRHDKIKYRDICIFMSEVAADFLCDLSASDVQKDKEIIVAIYELLDQVLQSEKDRTKEIVGVVGKLCSVFAAV